jgi:hypothetical protein
MSQRRELRVVFEVGDTEDPADFEAAASEAVRRVFVGVSPLSDLGALISVNVAPVVEPKVERKTPKTADWEHCVTTDAALRDAHWLPTQPRGDKSWQLCGALPHDRGGLTLFWKRELP